MQFEIKPTVHRRLILHSLHPKPALTYTHSLFQIKRPRTNIIHQMVECRQYTSDGVVVGKVVDFYSHTWEVGGENGIVAAAFRGDSVHVQ